MFTNIVFLHYEYNAMAPFGYCLNASTIRGTPVLQQIEAAAAAGFGAIELWFADTDAYLATGGSLNEICQALNDAGLVVPTMIYLSGWFECPDAEWERVKAECTTRIEQATVIGAQHVIAGPPGNRCDLATGATRYRELLEIGTRIGALPAFEFLGFVEQFCSIESALEVLSLAGGTTILDPFHVFRGGGSIESITKLKSEQIAISHFNDAPPSPPREQQHDSDRVWPGEGHLDLRHYLDLLISTGYNGWLSLELFREDLWAHDPREVARTGYAKMREVVEK